MTSPFKELTSSLLLGVVKSIILIYDIVTIPLYFILQMPWTKVEQSNDSQLRREVSGDKKSPWISSIRQMSLDSMVSPDSTQGCLTLHELMVKMIMFHKDKRCLGVREILMEEEIKDPDGRTVAVKKVQQTDYRWWSYIQINKKIDDVVKGLMANGLQKGDKVVISSSHRVESFLAIHAISRMGATAVLVHPNLKRDKLFDIIIKTSAKGLIIQQQSSQIGQQQSCQSGQKTDHNANCPISSILQQWRKREPQLDQQLKCIIIIETVTSSVGEGRVNPGFADHTNTNNSTTDQQLPRILIKSFSSLEFEGSSSPLSIGTSPSSPSDIAFIVYTGSYDSTSSGVLLTQTNLMTSLLSLDSTLVSGGVKGDKLSLSPKHPYPSFAPVTDISDFLLSLLMLVNGVPVGFSSLDTLTFLSPGVKEGCPGDLCLLRPKVIYSPPVVLDRLRRSVTEEYLGEKAITSSEKGNFRSSYLSFALDYSQYWKRQGFNTTLMNLFFFRSFAKWTGRSLETIIVPSGGNGQILCPKTQHFLRSTTGCSIKTGFSFLECGGFIALRTNEDFYSATSSIGSSLPGIRLKVSDYPESGFFSYDHPNPRGEVLIGGPMVATGFFEQPTDTPFCSDSSGIPWFKTGVIVEMDSSSGLLTMIDKKENLVKLSFGADCVPLGQTEANLTSCPFVDNLSLYANSDNNFILAFVSPIRSAIESLCRTLDIEEGSLSFKEMCSDPEIQAEVTRAIVSHGMAAGLPKKLLPSKVKLCSDSWESENGLVTAEGRPIRSEIARRYAQDINRMFGNVDHNFNLPPSATRQVTNSTSEQSRPNISQTTVQMETREGIEMTTRSPPETST